VLFLVLLAPGWVLAQDKQKEKPMNTAVSYRTVQVDDLSIFYREAGPKDAPALLLLHGLPSSSRMYEPLLQRLSDRYHLIAPDYPGFGHSDWPDHTQFAYTFDHIATVMEHVTEALGLTHYSLYMQDYGGPVGFRLALAHPERVQSLIVQDAVAHESGLGENWNLRRAFWADRATYEVALRSNLLSLATTRTRHVGNDPQVERYDPDLWTDEIRFLNQPGQADIQSDLFYDYQSNVASYPQWQEWMRQTQPRLLVLWGMYELSFDDSEPEAFRRDVSQAQVYRVDGGHFALDTAADEIANLVDSFLTGSRYIPTIVDSLIGAAGFLSMCLTDTTTPYLVFCFMLMTIGFGLAFNVPAMTNACIESAPRERLSIASAVLNAGRQVGSVLGVALLGTLVSSSQGFVLGMRVALVIAGTAFLAVCALSYFGIHETKESASATRAS